MARANAERLGLAVTFLEGDPGAPLAADAPFSLILANLPYIPTASWRACRRGARRAALALDGGADGLALVRRLVAAAPALLGAGGALVLEIGAGQARRRPRSCGPPASPTCRRRRDLAGIERVVSGVKA